MSAPFTTGAVVGLEKVPTCAVVADAVAENPVALLARLLSRALTR